MKTKKAVSPVVALALLLIVAVIGIVSFQNWLNSYSTTIFSDGEIRSNTNIILVENVFGNKIQFKSDYADELVYFKITATNGSTMCEIVDGDESPFQDTTRLLLTFDNSSTNATHSSDLSGYGNDALHSVGTFNNTECISGGCLRFTGVAGSAIVADSFSLDVIGDQLTLGYWVRPEIDVAGGSQQYPSLVIKRPFEVGGFGSHSVNTTGTMNFQYCQLGSCVGLLSTTALEAGNWYSYVVVMNGTNLSMYINGILEDEDSIQFDINTSTGTDLGIGYGFTGNIDEVIVYSKAVTEEQVLKMYQTQEARLYEQLLPPGGSQYDISNCDLITGQVYNFFGYSTESVVDEDFVAN